MKHHSKSSAFEVFVRRGSSLPTIPVAGYPPPLPKYVQWLCSPSLAPILLLSVTGWKGAKPTGGAEAPLQEFDYPTLPLSPVASAYSCLPLPVAWDSTTIQTFFEAGALLIHLLIHLAWRPAHRNYSVSIYWLASFQFTAFMALTPCPSTPLLVWAQEWSQALAGWEPGSHHPTLQVLFPDVIMSLVSLWTSSHFSCPSKAIKPTTWFSKYRQWAGKYFLNSKVQCKCREYK